MTSQAEIAPKAYRPDPGGILLTTASVPADQRFAFWRDIVCQTIAGVEATPLYAGHSYAGRIRSRPIPLRDMQHVDFLGVAADPQRVHRTRELVRLQAEEAWLVMIQEAGVCTIRQGDQQSTFAAGDIAFLDTSRPYEVVFPRAFQQSILKVPAALLNAFVPMRSDVAGMALAGSDPLTEIARHNLQLIARLAHTIDPAMLPAATARAVDHLGLAMRARLDSSTRNRDRQTAARHFARASAYIADHLHDPTLSVRRIAKALGVSAGHLHEIFRRTTGATVGDYVRTERLTRCRRDLADRSLRRHSITSIAYRWGFAEASSFSRAFRAAYQMSPRRYRQACYDDADRRSH
jgi:AraC-like DNA-binding protein